MQFLFFHLVLSSSYLKQQLTLLNLHQNKCTKCLNIIQSFPLKMPLVTTTEFINDETGILYRDKNSFTDQCSLPQVVNGIYYTVLLTTSCLPDRRLRDLRSFFASCLGCHIHLHNRLRSLHRILRQKD